MSENSQNKGKEIWVFEKYLTLLLAACIVVGIGVEKILPTGAAFATVVGVLVEVIVMFALVKIANNTKGWFKNN